MNEMSTLEQAGLFVAIFSAITLFVVFLLLAVFIGICGVAFLLN